MIILTSGEVIILNGTYIIERAEIRSIAILFFWFLYGSILSYQFWKNSKLMTEKVAIRRIQMIRLGVIFAILSYLLVIIAQLFQELTIQNFGQICAVLSGIVFYVGFIAPKWMRKIWENRVIMDYCSSRVIILDFS